MKSIIITGANSGIGFECAMQMAKIAPNEQIILACRNVQAGNESIQKIKQKTNHKHLICLPLDLASLQSIRDFKTAFLKLPNPQISALVNNAGIQVVGETKYTKDGFESTFGTNHLGNFYLALLLLPFVDKNGSITFTASGTHDPKQKTGMPAPEFTTPELLAYPKDKDDKPIAIGQKRYTTSKLCNILTVYELQRRLANTNIRVNAFDPGLVPGTGLAKNYPPFLKFVSDYVFKILILFHPNVNTASNSGKRLADLAYSEKYKNAKGKYFEGVKEIKSSENSYKEAYQADLWNGSIELTRRNYNTTKMIKNIIPIALLAFSVFMSLRHGWSAFSIGTQQIKTQ
jgi:NAD(P)-dependent dehydrogenase (short-subunit alcohol dehydrogenase family)